jgi:hypothetical protein
MTFPIDIKKPSWNVVLWKEVRSRKEVANIENVFITTTMEMDGLSALERFPPTPTTTSLIGAIKLFLTRTIF